MHESGSLPAQVTVCGLRLEPLGGGVGFTGETVRVRLSYVDTTGAAIDPGEPVDGFPEGLPETIVAKFPTRDRANRGMLEALDSYGREIAFYQDLAADVPLRVPAHHGSDLDPPRGQRASAAGGRLIERLPPGAHLAITRDVTKLMRVTGRRYALLIEDLGPGATVHDLVNPPPPERMRQLVAGLAELHATYWGRSDLRSHRAMRTLITDTPNLYANVLRGRCRGIADERWASWLTPDMRAVLDEAPDRFDADLVTINEPLTLLHGDPRSDNVLYLGDGSMAILDWSLVTVGHPAYDVAYAISAGVRATDAPSVRSELIDHYLAELDTRGVAPSRDDFDRSYAAAVRALLLQNILGLQVLKSEGYGEDEHIADLWCPRLFAAVGAAPSADFGDTHA